MDEQKIKVPTIITIFGVAGDLSQRKLFPALLDLYIKGMLAEQFRIIGVGRREWTNEELRSFLREAIDRKGHHHPEESIQQFLALCTYAKGDFSDDEMYAQVAKNIKIIDDEFGVCTNKLFYLAVSPDFYEVILKQIAAAGLGELCGGADGWTRILIEKPFGKDLATAEALERLLSELYMEEQIFRIDHYLGKETIQNMLSFRFSNLLYETQWNNKYIEMVHLRLDESLGVEDRAKFYDGVGALRDVGQNHLLQMLAFVAMENPGGLSANEIRERREDVLRAIVPFDTNTITHNTLRGQYEGYRNAKDVLPESKTETYFLLKVFLDNARWRGVPFFMESGKRLSASRTDITIYFKDVVPCLCPAVNHERHQNVLRFRIQPNESIELLFWVKQPGFHFGLKPARLAFAYADSPDTSMIPDAYERILYDCIQGDQTLFVSTKEVELAWKFIMQISEGWQLSPLVNYASGSIGPEERRKILPENIID